MIPGPGSAFKPWVRGQVDLAQDCQDAWAQAHLLRAQVHLLRAECARLREWYALVWRGYQATLPSALRELFGTPARARDTPLLDRRARRGRGTRRTPARLG